MTIGPGDVAFQHDHRLYLASLAGPERPVARRELPLGWARGGLYTYRYHPRELLLRSDGGALIKTIARQPLGSDYFVSDGSLYFIADGVLERANGRRIHRLAALASLGVSRDSYLQSVGRLLELEDNQRLVVLDRDGALFASIALREGHSGGLSSSLVPAPHAGVVAFASTSSHGSSFAETVYLLHRGAHRAVPLHTEWVHGGGCQGGTNVQWHGDWLLYSDSRGELAAIDTAGTQRTIELSGLIRRLAGSAEGLAAYWTGHPVGS